MFGGGIPAEGRVWRCRDGCQIRGEFDRLIGDKLLIVDPAGKKHYLRFEDLSERDAAYLDEIRVPGVDIRFEKKLAPKPRSRAALPSDQIFIVTGSVKVESKEKRPNSSLRAEVYLVGKEIESGKYKTIGKASSVLRFSEENDYAVRFGVQGESRKFEEYNGQDRGVLYHGYAVFVFNRDGDIVDHATSLSWLTEESFDSFRQLKPWWFYKENCQRTSVPRPKYSVARGGIH